MNLNNIPERQNSPPLQRLLKARQHIYAVAARYQYAQLFLSVLVPLVLAVVAGLMPPEQRGPFAVVALLITLLDVAIIDRKMRKTLVLAAQVSEELDCTLLEMPWNSFIAGKKASPDIISTAAANYCGKSEKLIDWYPVAAGRAPMHMARLICQHTNLWYDGTLRRAYSTWLALIGVASLIGYAAFGFYHNVGFADWAIKMAIAAPVVIWTVREYFRQHDASEAVKSVKSNGECVWDDALEGRDTPEATIVQSREFQNGIYVRRANNPLLFPFIYWFQRDGMEAQMDISAEDRLKALGIV